VLISAAFFGLVDPRVGAAPCVWGALLLNDVSRMRQKKTRRLKFGRVRLSVLPRNGPGRLSQSCEPSKVPGRIPSTSQPVHAGSRQLAYTL
jgi:hypothetical protein